MISERSAPPKVMDFDDRRAERAETGTNIDDRRAERAETVMNINDETAMNFDDRRAKRADNSNKTRRSTSGANRNDRAET